MTLILKQNIKSPDDAYSELIAAHEGLSKTESERLNARLILILMNQIGELATIREALTAARKNTVERN